MCSEKLLSLKTAFLMAITSTRRVSELAALRSDFPYLQMHPDNVILYLDIAFLSKVVSDFHINQPIVLPTFPSPSMPLERKLHTLDVRRALAFYLHRTKLGAPRISSCVIMDHIKVLLFLHNQYPDGLYSLYSWFTSLPTSLYRTD